MQNKHKSKLEKFTHTRVGLPIRKAGAIVK